MCDKEANRKRFSLLQKIQRQSTLQRVRQSGKIGKLECRRGVIGDDRIEMCPQEYENTVF